MKYMRLYEIADAYMEVLEALPAMEKMPADAIADTLEGWVGTFEQKALAIAAYIRNLEAEADAVEEARKRMESRHRALKAHADSMHKYLHREMERVMILKVKSPELVLRIQKNPPSVQIDDEKLIPGKYLEIVTTKKVLKSEIGKAIRAGEEIPGTHLEQSTRLVIV